MGSKGSRTYLIILFTIIMFVFALVPRFGFYVIKTDAKSEEDDVNFLSTVHFIDVGQGDCIFIEFPNKKTCIIDGGSSIYSAEVVKYIQNLGYSKIDIMIATHADADHVGGLSAVLANFEVKRILRPYVLSRGSLLESPDKLELVYENDRNIVINSEDSYASFINLAYKETFDGEASDVEIVSNLTLFTELNNVDESIDFNLEVISPIGLEDDYLCDTRVCTKGYKVAYSDDDDRSNTNSAVILYTIQNQYEERKFLFTADATATTEMEILARCSENTDLQEKLCDVDVLKVAHHGSKNSTTTEFLDLVRPHSAVISVGIDNDYGHPDSGTIDRLRNYVASDNLFRTDMSGSIKLRFGDDGNLWVEVNKISVNDPIPNWVLYLVLGLVLFSIIAIIVINLIQRKLEKKLKPEQTEENLENTADFYKDKNLKLCSQDLKDSTNNCQTYETKSGQITLLDPNELSENKKRKR